MYLLDRELSNDDTSMDMDRRCDLADHFFG